MPERSDHVVRILGTRGVPGAHGGFESWAEDLSLYLAERGWTATVYCQEHGRGGDREEDWHGVRLIQMPVPLRGTLGACIFDLRSTLHALREDGLVLVFGYHTAILSLLYRMKGITTLLNMDGMEWQRRKYALPERAWLWINEWIGTVISDHLIADHPAVARRLKLRRSWRDISMIPYGSRSVERAEAALLDRFGLVPGQYALLMARPEPENSVLEVVRAFSGSRRPVPLVVVGKYSEDHPYQRAVREAASQDVRFVGPVYERGVVDALRFHARLYIHGHTVGGTNPALVEALGAGTPVLAHDNRFNRAVMGSAGAYFADETKCGRCLNDLLTEENSAVLLEMSRAGRARHTEAFRLEERLRQYEQMLLRIDARTTAAPALRPAPVPKPARAGDEAGRLPVPVGDPSE